MSERGAAYDNAVVETFLASLETECVPTHGRPPRGVLIRVVASWIEDWYNRRRRHSSLGYRAPAEYEAHLPASA
jgi:transposase InsO family protein